MATVVKGARYNVPFQYALAGWWRYRRGLTNQSGCSAWLDATNNSRTLLQATASKRPAIMSDGTLLFDGTSHTMTAAFTLVQPFSVYMLFGQVTWTSGDIILDGSTGTTKWTQTGSTPAIAMNGGSALSGGSSIPVGNQTFGCACGVFNGTSSVYQSAGGGPSVTITGDAGAGNPGGITIGSDRSGTNPANIMVREVIMYSIAHDAPTRLQILRYLSKIASSVGGVS